MKCGKILRSFVLVFLLLLSVYCYSLSPGEIEALKTMDAQILTDIIVEYDKALTKLEISITEREKETKLKETQLNKTEKSLDLREINLEKRESEQDQIEKLLIQQESLFQKSLVMHNIEIKKTKFIYGSGGLLIGILFGYPVGYYQQ